MYKQHVYYMYIVYWHILFTRHYINYCDNLILIISYTIPPCFIGIIRQILPMYRSIVLYREGVIQKQPACSCILYTSHNDGVTFWKYASIYAKSYIALNRLYPSRMYNTISSYIIQLCPRNPSTIHCKLKFGGLNIE